jgi:hypothetical protein
LQDALFSPIFRCAGATAAVKCPCVLRFRGSPALTLRRGADKNRALLRQAVNFAASERPPLNPASKDMFF